VASRLNAVQGKLHDEKKFQKEGKGELGTRPAKLWAMKWRIGNLRQEFKEARAGNGKERKRENEQGS